MKKFSPDFWVQFAIMIITGICALGAFFAFCDSRYAHSDVVIQQFSAQVDSQKELRKEVHQLYLKLIPGAERAQ